MSSGFELTGRARPARKGLWRGWIHQSLDDGPVFTALDAQGESLKRSRKASVQRVEGWVVKRAAGGGIPRTLRLSFQRRRARQAWIAAQYLSANGVSIPEPIAYLERRCLGLILDQAMVSQFLTDYRNVEHFMKALVECGAGGDTIHDFLLRLADAVNRLNATGAYHADLSGKNIFTRDGFQFAFIDLDAVALNVEYTEERRLKNHIQLYDSFCDFVTDRALVPFIQHMLSRDQDLRVWMPKVRSGQAKRRATIEAKWAKQGKLAL